MNKHFKGTSTYQFVNKHFKGCIVVDLGSIEMNKEENVSPHVVFMTDMVIKTLKYVVKLNEKYLTEAN